MSTSPLQDQSSAQTGNMTKKYHQFLLLGDSIVQNMSLLRDGVCPVAALAEHCERTLDIVNRGLSGYNTAMELVILEHLIPSPSFAKVDYLLIMFGANDSCLPSSPSKQHVPIDKYKENLRAIITHPSVQAHKPKIILVCPPPINEHQLASGNLALTRSAKTTALYSGAVGELAGDLVAEGIDNIVYINFWYAITKKAMELDKPTPDSRDSNCDVCSLEKPDSPGLRSLLVDGLHLTGAGYQVLLEKILPHIGPEWRSLPDDNQPWIFPHWSIAPRIE